MIEKYSRDLYPREVIIKTAYAFLDKYYVHLDMNDSEYIFDIIAKDNANNIDIKQKLDNEIIFQLARFTISIHTSEVRKLVMGRAFSSSMIMENKEMPEYNPGYISYAEKILKDWFEKNE